MVSTLNDDVPIFNLSAVVRDTGVKPDTLRAWERRYGLPEPQRTEGGHRLYSRRDIETVKWLMAQREQGLGISKAVKLWRQLEKAAVEDTQAADFMRTPSLAQEDHDRLAAIKSDWLKAGLAFDERAAREILAEAFAIFPVERVCFDVLLPAMVDVGQGWYEGKVTVQQEHFITGLATRQLDALIVAAPPPSRPGRILAASPPSEYHIFALQMLTLMLKRNGYEVVFLGADVPIDHIVDTVHSGHFQLVISAAQRLDTAALLAELAQLLQKSNTPLLYGGGVFIRVPELRERIAGQYLGDNLDGTVPFVETLLVAQPSPIPVEPPPKELIEARKVYLKHLPALESRIEQAIPGEQISERQLERANSNMSQGISAALSLGDMQYMAPDMVWVEGLLTYHGMPENILNLYLHAYAAALNSLEDDRLQPIHDWLNDILTKEDNADTNVISKNSHGDETQ